MVKRIAIAARSRRRQLGRRFRQLEPEEGTRAGLRAHACLAAVRFRESAHGREADTTTAANGKKSKKKKKKTTPTPPAAQ